MAMFCKRSLLLLAGVGLAGCQTVDPVSQSPDPRFGEVTAWNKAVQIINPDPQYPAGAAQPGSSGTRGAAAVDRYNKGNVKETERIGTGDGGGGGGGR
jgi:hypothetical protein